MNEEIYKQTSGQKFINKREILCKIDLKFILINENDKMIYTWIQFFFPQLDLLSVFITFSVEYISFLKKREEERNPSQI